MAQNDIYLVRQKADGTFEEIANSPFQYDAASASDVPNRDNNTFHINTKLRVDELEVNGQTTVIDQDTTTSEQLLVTNDGTGPAAVINQLGNEGIIDIQDDGHSSVFVRGDSSFAGFVGLNNNLPTERLHVIAGNILIDNANKYMAEDSNGIKIGMLGMLGDVVQLTNGAAGGLSVSTSGNVGIGTDQPSEKLDINGTVKASRAKLANLDIRSFTEATAGVIENLLPAGNTSKFGTIIETNPNGQMIFGIRGNDENDAFTILTKNYVASTTDEASRPYNYAAFCVKSNSNVGIGTASPSSKLDVIGVAACQGLSIEKSTTYDTAITPTIALGSSNADTVNNGQVYKYTFGLDGDAAGHGLVINQKRRSDTDRQVLTIDSNGNAGIGTTSPSGLLHVKGDTNSNGAELFLQVNNNNTTDNIGAINFGNNINSNLSQILSGTSGANNSSYLALSTSDEGNLAEHMRIDSSGNVGVDTTDPAEKLHVSAGKLLVAAYDIPIAVGDGPVAGATFFSRREPDGNGTRYGSGIDIVPISEEGHCSPFIRFYDSAANGDYDDALTGDSNWAMGADDQAVSTFRINWGGGADSPKPLSIRENTPNSGTPRLSIDGPTGNLKLFNGDIYMPSNIRHVGDGTTYFGFHGNASVGVTTNGSQRLLITDTATTVNNVFQAHGGAVITSNEDNDTPELTLKRNASTNASGDDDIVDIRVQDSGLNFIINNASDGEGGSYSFKRTLIGGSEILAPIHCGLISTSGSIRNDDDPNTYHQFHEADKWRVVTDGVQRLEVTNEHTKAAGDLIVQGDLTVNGDTVTLNTTNLDIEDKLIKVAKNATNAATADGCGLDFGGQYKLTFQSEATNKLVIEDTADDIGSLEIQGTGGAQLILQDTNSSNTTNQTGIVTWKTANDTVTAEVGFINNSDSDFTVKNSAGDLILLAEDTRITGSGSTTIGDVTPSSIKLDVRGADIGSNIGDSTHLAQIRGSRHKLLFTEVRHDTAASGVNWDGVTYKLQKRVDSTDMQSINFVNDNGAAAANNHIDLYVGGHTGSDPFLSTRFAGNGKVGIGTTIPEAKLHIAGDNTNSGGLLIGHTSGAGIDSLRFYIDSNNKAHITRGVSEKMTIESNGNIGIGTTNPSHNLDVAGDINFTGTLYQNGVAFSSGSNFSGNYNDLTNKPTLFSGNYNELSNKPTLFSGNYNELSNKPTIPNSADFVGTDAGMHTMQGTLDVTGTNNNESIRATGDIVAMSTSASDDALKTNKVTIDGALDKVCSLNGFTFDWNEKAAEIGIQDEGSIGLSAQEIEKVVPEVVKPLSNTEYKYVNYEKLVPVLVEAIKELKSEIEQLKSNQCDC